MSDDLDSIALPPPGLVETLLRGGGWSAARIAAPMLSALRAHVPDWCESAEDEAIIAQRLVKWHLNRSRFSERARSFKGTLLFWYSYVDVDFDIHGWHARLNLDGIMFQLAQRSNPRQYWPAREVLYVTLVEHRVRALLGEPLHLSLQEMRGRHYARRWAAATVLARRRVGFVTALVWRYLFHCNSWWDLIALAEESN